MLIKQTGYTSILGVSFELTLILENSHIKGKVNSILIREVSKLKTLKTASFTVPNTKKILFNVVAF